MEQTAITDEILIAVARAPGWEILYITASPET